MKESVAITKWCPHTRMVFGYEKGTTQPFNRFATEPGDEMEAMQKAMNGSAGTKCVGSACMMWEPEYEEESKELKPDKESPGDDWIKKQRIAGQPNVVWVRFVPIDQGDCGLKTKRNRMLLSGLIT